MYGTLSLTHRTIDDLREHTGGDAIDELRRLARPIEGLRVLNLSVTGFGTGTAELLSSSVPLLNDLGIDAHWQVARASEEAAIVSRAMYRALGGAYVHWTHEMTETWLSYAALNADLLTEEFDVVVVHDPQPVAMRSYVKDGGAKWVLDCHLDLSSAQTEVWMLIRAHIEGFRAAIFPSPSFARQDLSLKQYVVPPAIDPNSARNMDLPRDVIRGVLVNYGLDPDRPIMSHVSPCDAESDMTGVVDIWERVREKHPELQLAFVVTTEPSDPGSRACFDDLARRLQAHTDAIVVSGREVGNVELNVFQRSASVVVQKGLRKGFGLWVSDALWKERACVVCPQGGLTEQVIDGETGIIARTPEEFAAAITLLLENPDEARRLGKNGRRHVAEHFLISRYLRDYLVTLDELHRTK